MDKLQKKQWNFTVIYLIIALVLLYIFQTMRSAPRPRQVAY